MKKPRAPEPPPLHDAPTHCAPPPDEPPPFHDVASHPVPPPAPAGGEIETRLNDGGHSLQARNEASVAGRARGGRVHLVLGPVGAGKSTYAAALAGERGAVRLNLDQWMVRLFGPDRPDEGRVVWYLERAARAVEQIRAVAVEVAGTGTDVVLEIGLLTRHERDPFYRRISDAGFELTIHVLDAARDVRRRRVEARNRERGSTFCMVVPPDVFERASDLWEPPAAEECAGRDVRFVRTDLP
jgi:predicted kinase